MKAWKFKKWECAGRVEEGAGIMDRYKFRKEINKLTLHHRKACKAYDGICDGLDGTYSGCGTDGPFLPVAIFKSLELRSIPEEAVKRRLTSSGTTGQQVSKIYLDGETAAAQQRALCDIVSKYIGEKRIPMLIIDSPDVLRDRKKYSARGAGIMGFSMMASKRFYALNSDMKPDMESIKAFAEAADRGPCFAFGFTYMIWQYFCGSDICEADKTSGIRLPSCHLIHGGGWKKLQSQAVSNAEFKARLKELWGIEKVSDYYGMAEQTGSIFMECECGHLHVSEYSDVFALRSEDFTPCETGEWGLLALESILPKSYPGHKLMTEDWGRILGEDDCPCGRPGKYFEIKGRIKKAEIRGCSDTFAADDNRMTDAGFITSASQRADEKRHVEVSAQGVLSIESGGRRAFDETALNYLEELSKLFTKDHKYRSVPEIYALGFWCRRAHIEKLRSRQQTAWADKQDAESANSRKGRGLVLHIAPSNMPTMFAYSWICTLLAGCSSIVRISTKENAVTDMILDGIRRVMDRPGYDKLKAQNSFVRFGHSDEMLAEISQYTAGRIIWGGDETVAHISSIPSQESCVDIVFPDKYSIALLDGELISHLSEEELKHSVHLFYNDTYSADQNACSSPKTVFWTGEKAGRDRWWAALAREAKNYNLEPWMATEKYRMLCCEYAKAGVDSYSDGGTAAMPGPLCSFGNRLYVVPWKLNKNCTNSTILRLSNPDAKMGLFHEFAVNDINEIVPLPDGKIQTVVSNINRENLPPELIKSVDRVVAIGEALDFDTIWDRKDIIDMLTQE